MNTTLMSPIKAISICLRISTGSHKSLVRQVQIFHPVESSSGRSIANVTIALSRRQDVRNGSHLNHLPDTLLFLTWPRMAMIKRAT